MAFFSPLNRIFGIYFIHFNQFTECIQFIDISVYCKKDFDKVTNVFEMLLLNAATEAEKINY